MDDGERDHLSQDQAKPHVTRADRLWAAAETRAIPLRTILATVAVVALVYLAGKVIYRLRDVLLLMLVAGFIAVILNQMVVALQRWIPQRALAVVVVTVLGLVVFIGLALLFGVPLVNGFAHLADSLPSYVSQAERGRGAFGHLVRKYHVYNWVQHNVPKLLSIGQGLARPALMLGKGAFSLLLSLAIIFVLVLLMLLEAPKLRKAILKQVPQAQAERVSRVAREVSRSVTGYMLGNALTSLIAGVVVLVTLLVLRVPFPFLWALWVALVDFLPMIGGALAGVPTVLFAATHSLVAGLITLVVFVAYTQVENHVLNPWIMSRTVHVSPLLVLISILVGASIGSWVGGTFGGLVAALLAIPLAGAIQAVIREIWQATGPEHPDPAGVPDQARADPS
jgi:predicted PurR-regulated permease PerM